VSVCLLSHESTERDDWRDAGEEEEDDRRQTLHVETVLQHADVRHRMVAVLNVVDHAAEKPASDHDKKRETRSHVSSSKSDTRNCINS